MKAILTGNFVSGFKAYECPDDEDIAKFFLGRVPESRLIDVYPYDDLMTEHNPAPAPEPVVEDVSDKDTTEVDDGDGAATDGTEGASGDDSDGPGDGAPQ
jgi:hypothetical protein